MTSRPKILIALDLDYTHFATCRYDGVHWIGSKEERVSIYLYLIKKAKTLGIDVIFSVVTSKEKYDDICDAASLAFRELLHRGNLEMIAEFDGKEYILVDKFGRLVYECLTEDKRKAQPRKKSMHSHFHIVSGGKVDSLLDIAKAHEIPPERIIILDDTDYVLRHARDAGMNAVSFECFNDASIEFFEDKANVLLHLEKCHVELFKVFEGVMLSCIPPAQKLASAQVQEDWGDQSGNVCEEVKKTRQRLSFDARVFAVGSSGKKCSPDECFTSSGVKI